ncbi:MAG: hypothetical protein A2Y80_09870 [Deltaproteobacteria bacterium RBG_13_58_19]|nr:MAG: hypothetical protein A2Y80_09870 [Deltaproteobacteria bacterium RBG_13_58_19]
MGNNRRKIWVFALGSFLGLLLLGSAIHPTLPWMSSPDPVTATVEKPGPGLATPNHSLLSQEFQVPPNLSSLIASWSPENAVRERARRTPPLTPAQLEKLIKEYARRHGLDESLVWAVVRHESGFNCRAVSPKGAMGLMQLMPATAVLVGVKDPFNAEENIAGGVKYLKLCLTRFDQDVALALAAYNAGPGNVAKYQGCPPFPETRNYVAAVLRDYGGKHPQAGRARKNGSPPGKKDLGLAWSVPKPQWKIAGPQSKIPPPRWKGSAS